MKTAEEKKLKKRVNEIYKIIESANEELRQIRKTQCMHSGYEICTYSPRPGQYFENTKICSICGEVLEIPKMKYMQNRIR